MKNIFNKYYSIVILAGCTLLPPVMGCNKYLNEPLPSGEITQANAFVSDNSISAVVTGNFMNLVNTGFFNGGGYAGDFEFALYTDETLYYNTGDATALPFLYYLNEIVTDDANANFWSPMYNQIYDVNAALAGIQGATATLYYKNQWLGESYFNRAVEYFYLTNLYGPVPLALTTDYAVTDALGRAPQTQVYQQIVSDLQQARSLLNYSYTNAYGATTSDRVRPDRYSATAMLAKVYLYEQKWDSAEMMADSVIANTSTYALEPLSSVFTANGKETIWSVEIPPTNTAPQEYIEYIGSMPVPIPSGSTPNKYSVYSWLDTALVNTFEPGDGRLTTWTRQDSITGSPGSTFYSPYKYNTQSTTTQLPIILRMGELYLIRAEARAEQGNIAGAQSDLNAVRTRAGLPATTATDQPSLLTAIMHERRVELFTENGNRFFDLKRWGTIDSVMTAYDAIKGSGATWSTYKQLLPLPSNDLQQDPNLNQNTGYAVQ